MEFVLFYLGEVVADLPEEMLSVLFATTTFSIRQRKIGQNSVWSW